MIETIKTWHQQRRARRRAYDAHPPHPAKMAPTRWIFHDRSHEDPLLQILDVLTDIRNLALIALLVWVFS